MSIQHDDISTTALKLACVDTSTFTESLALLEGDRLIGERIQFRAKGHASGLHSDLSALLAEAGWHIEDLDAFVCGLGPGSFTGMRVGLAAFKGFAFALKRPLCGIPTSKALLATADTSALALIDARRGEVYADGAMLKEARCLRPQALIELIDQQGLAHPTQVLGEGALRYADLFKTAWPDVFIPVASAHVPRASLFAQAALKLLQENRDRWSDPALMAALEPIYVRPSDAEINYPDGFPSESRLFGAPKLQSILPTQERRDA